MFTGLHGHNWDENLDMIIINSFEFYSIMFFFFIILNFPSFMSQRQSIELKFCSVNNSVNYHRHFLPVPQFVKSTTIIIII